VVTHRARDCRGAERNVIASVAQCRCSPFQGVRRISASAAPGPADALTVSVRPSVPVEPATALIRVTVERHPDNRRLVIQADSGTYYRSSLRQLDGQFAARTHAVRTGTLESSVNPIAGAVYSSSRRADVRLATYRVLHVLSRSCEGASGT
jgi:hypothetical protein